MTRVEVLQRGADAVRRLAGEYWSKLDCRRVALALAVIEGLRDVEITIEEHEAIRSFRLACREATAIDTHGKGG